MPGLLMGVLQFGWLGVNIAISANFIVQAAGQPSVVDGAGVFTGSTAFTIIAVLWGLAAAFIGVKGIQYVAKVATYLPLVPLVMIIVVLLTNIGGVGKFEVAKNANPMVAIPDDDHHDCWILCHSGCRRGRYCQWKPRQKGCPDGRIGRYCPCDYHCRGHCHADRHRGCRG